MRTLLLPIVALFALAACSSDASSTSGPGTTTGNTGTTYNVAVDSANATRTLTAGSSGKVTVMITLDGKPAGGIPVNWKPSAGSGTVSDTLTGSDSLGFASTTWTINDTAKVNTLTAYVGTSSATLQTTGIAGPASALVKVSPDSVAVVAGANALLTVRVTDREGNPVSGIAVAWSASAGSLSLANSTTSSSGNADETFTAPTSPGTSLITASVGGIGSVVFHVTGL